MKKQTLLPILAFAAVAVTTLTLPTTASADSFRHNDPRTASRSEQQRGHDFQPVHDRHYRYDDDDRRYAPRFRHDHGRHIGHDYRPAPRVEYRPAPLVEYRPAPRVEYRPMEREEYRRNYRPVELYAPVPSDNIRLRISYDLHL